MTEPARSRRARRSLAHCRGRITPRAPTASDSAQPRAAGTARRTRAALRADPLHTRRGRRAARSPTNATSGSKHAAGSHSNFSAKSGGNWPRRVPAARHHRRGQDVGRVVGRAGRLRGHAIAGAKARSAHAAGAADRAVGHADARARRRYRARVAEFGGRACRAMERRITYRRHIIGRTLAANRAHAVAGARDDARKPHIDRSRGPTRAKYSHTCAS